MPCPCDGGTGCTCAAGAPVGWKKLSGGGRFGHFGPGPFGGPFGNSSNNNNNNNNNNNSSNNANSQMSSMLSGLMNNAASGGCNGGFSPFGGFGGPLGGLGFGGPGFGGPFAPSPPLPGGCCAPPPPFPFPGDGCWGCPPPGYGGCGCGGCTGCSGAWSCTGPTGGVCNGVCWKKFTITSPNGQTQCFPVAVPWWCCDATGTTFAAPLEAEETLEATGPAAAEPEPTPAASASCMSASQLLMQRYMIANPPRAFGQSRRAYEVQPEIDPEIPFDNTGPQFLAAAESQRNAVLIPSDNA